ncbi:EAL domain-containing protein [Thiomicrorhabdus sp.]|uniref:EAL domain-containing protein n=1 Tax=Thiomicrorhabdus sp. TaxID=2039724 RepID=UPI002AA7F974|nr:EAL domain-containing protein [Thiomicrorhabdus sp.]
MNNTSTQPNKQNSGFFNKASTFVKTHFIKSSFFVFSLLCIVIIYAKTHNPLIQESAQITQNTYYLNILQSNIIEIIALSKSKEIKHFDDINRQAQQLNKTLAKLSDTLAIKTNHELANQLNKLIVKTKQQQALIESFKTAHAIKQISINYLPAAFAECTKNINKLNSVDKKASFKVIQEAIIQVLNFNKRANRQASYDLKNINHQIIENGLQDSCKAFIQHNDSLTKYLSQEDAIFNQIQNLSLNKDLQQFYLNVEQQVAQAISKNNIFYFILIFLSLLLLAFISISYRALYKQNKQSSLAVKKLSQQQGLFTTLIKLNRATANIHEKRALFQAVCDITHTEASLDSCWIGLVDESGFVKAITAAGEGQDIIMSFQVPVTDNKINGTIAESYRKKAPVITNDFQTRLLNSSWAELASTWDIKGSATLPILHDDKVLGFFITYTKKTNFFNDEINTLLEQLASDLGTALEKIKLENEQIQRQQDLAISAIAFESHEAIMITDANNIIIRANRAFNKLTGFSLDECLGKKPSILKSGLHDATFYKELWANLNKTGKWQGEIWNRKKDGTLYPAWQSISTLFDDENQVTHYISHSMDLTKDKESQREIHYLNNHDSLTKLPNRSLLIDRLDQQIGQHNSNYSFLFLININRFKLFNESLGHTAGDQLLIQVAERLKNLKLENIFNLTVARIGSDEFALLCLTDIDELEDSTIEAGHIASQLQHNLTQPFIIQNNQVVIDISIGVTLFTNHSKSTQTPETLLQEANTALHRAKQSSVSSVQFFEANMQIQAQNRLTLETDLRTALHNQEFVLHYQPQFSLLTNDVIGFESLIRWQNKQKGLIPPNDFIPILEETGLITQVGAWVIEESINQAQEMHQYNPNLTMSVNLSAVQFNDTNLVNNVAALLKQTSYPASKLEFEITESLLMTDINETILKLNKLTELGIKIAIDDFGTGYSSLAYLKQFPVNRLKIDKSFVDDISDPNDVDSAIVRATIEMAHALHINTIAEGVEEKIQQQLLYAFGCDEAQGYFYSKPIPANELHKFMQNQIN